MAKPSPRVTDINRPYYEGGIQQKLRLQHCRSCDRWIFYPRVVCPHCWEEQLEWKDASGKGAVYSFALVFRHHHPSFEKEGPTVLAAVKLAEGPVVISEIVGCDPANVHIGMEVRAVWEMRNGSILLPRFQPIETGVMNRTRQLGI